MIELLKTPIYISLFISLYFEIFLLITYIEKRDNIKSDTEKSEQTIKKYPTVTIMVPCWNEEHTVSKTIHSLLNLDYPKDKLKIIAIDDGSTDGTWEVLQKFERNPQIEMYHKENGGKHTALNVGLEHVTSDLVGCLDADSYVQKDALKHMIWYFNDKETMVVTPSIKVWKPKTIIQRVQHVEYHWGILMRKMLSYLGAMYVTPGPFSIFRKEVFDNLGGYKHAHMTEDMELAIRMQINGYKIVNAHNADVYTTAPKNLKQLYKQRTRWTYGFINNSIDNKHIFFKKEYGNLGMYILPMAGLSILTTLYFVSLSLISFIESMYNQYIKISTIGLHIVWKGFNFDWFYINTQMTVVTTFVIFCGTLAIIFISRKLSEGKFTFGLDIIYFLSLYVLIAPLWMARAVYNTIFGVKARWR